MRLIVEHLRHSFRGVGELFGGLSHEFQEGSFVALVGPSGSGKSTLLSLLAGWERPVGGSVLREGIDSIGWVFQNPHGVARRSAIHHVCEPLFAKGMSRKGAVAEAGRIMARFGLDSLADRPFAALSGGEAQRLMLARAIAKQPDLLLVDEPTAQLDPAASDSVNRVLGELSDSRMIVVVATHDQGTAAACRERLVLGGRTVQGGG
jgi:ABC-type lipoprotein export system ATPase subunit